MTTARPYDSQDQPLARNLDSILHEADRAPRLTTLPAPALEQPLSTHRNRPPWVAGGHG
jgi:hypothetical protein